MHIQDNQGNRVCLKPGDQIIFYTDNNSVGLTSADRTPLYFKPSDNRPQTL